MIVGADDTTDADVLGASNALYQRFKMKRVYYSAFSPIEHASGILAAEGSAARPRASALSSGLAAALLRFFRR